ncbi:hypothetical protein [Chlamydia caviae]|uniref:Uncharacterized protein n=1 Tax=Chlamydia caviae (strain ATCC VR-813 / DSM 19441 / 03DC25 / GPIC) TaxID=227941 RepID=Q823A3_CHLCV|nr:hypothetical protein [Chlamydia caviae]AAP05266.1 conserved hypothetical protein [Chlamydia caviae GPIC]
MSTSNSNNNNNDCYFSVDSIFEEDVVAGNVQTNDTKANSIVSTNSFSVTTPGNASFKGAINASGLTSANALKIENTQSTASIDLHGNRLSNVARPTHDSSPVPANYVRSPEYFFCSLNQYGRIYINSSTPIPIIGPDRIVYQSHSIFSHIRFVDYVKHSVKSVTYPGTQWVQLLSKGIYMIDFGINKRWGWDNGWGSDVALEDADGTIYSNNTIYSGGGYADQAALSTAVNIKNPPADPNSAILNQSNLSKSLFSARLAGNGAALSGFYFGIIFYPEDNG